MMAFYITGDIHGDIARFLPENWQGHYGLPPLTKEDVVLICGDFGVPWGFGKGSLGTPREGKATERDEAKLDALAELDAAILFIDGNHENFPILRAFPEKERYGGRVHELRPNIVHLERGEIYEVQGISLFAFGGALSIDRAWRTPGESWWQEETYNEAEYENAIRHLEAADWHADLVVTHTAPFDFIRQSGAQGTPPVILHRRFGIDKTAEMLEDLYPKMHWKLWYFGHFHSSMINKAMKFRGIYKEIDRIR